MVIADLHIHTCFDPHDTYISATPQQLIDAYHEQGFSLLSFTHHNKLLYKQSWKQYAQSKNILLVPGIEKTIMGIDVLIINATSSAETITNFGMLRQYKKNNPKSLIIAPHPFGKGVSSIGNDIFTYADCFDALELSPITPFSSYSNKHTKNVAKKLNLPLLANSDTHHLMQVGSARTHISGTTWQQVKQNIAKQRISTHLRMNTIKKYGVLYPLWLLKKHVIPRQSRHVE